MIQQKLNHFSELNEQIPPSGWIKAIRISLNLTLRQLADRVGVSHGSIAQLEKREPKKKVTLESLENAAQAMNCKVIYAIVPQESGTTLDDIIKSKAKEAALRILKDVAHTMRLEAQGTSDEQIKSEVERITEQLIETGDSRIWSVDKKKLRTKKNV